MDGIFITKPFWLLRTQNIQGKMQTKLQAVTSHTHPNHSWILCKTNDSSPAMDSLDKDDFSCINSACASLNILCCWCFTNRRKDNRFHTESWLPQLKQVLSLRSRKESIAYYSIQLNSNGKSVHIFQNSCQLQKKNAWKYLDVIHFLELISCKSPATILSMHWYIWCTSDLGGAFLHIWLLIK